MKIAVLGAGLMGRAAVYDIAQNDQVDEVGIYDIDADLATEVANKFGYGKARSGVLDASDESAATEVLSNYDALVSCAGYQFNPTLTRAAIAGKCHMVDLGGNNDIVSSQLQMHQQATEADVIIVPDCGLAPGMVAVMAADAVSKMDQVSSLKIRVGGLPQVPRPPLNYQMVFSAEGLINEYWEPCVILDGGQKKTVNPMTAVELLEFDGIGKLEAFYTSGGTSTLPDTYQGVIDFLDYKTIRYPGHCQLFRPILEIGLASRSKVSLGESTVEPRTVLKAVLDKNLSFGDLDMVLVRLIAEGEKDGSEKTIIYEIIDRQKDKASLTAMMRTTAFPAAIIAQMAASGEITARGCLPQEKVVNPSSFFSKLKKRGVNLVITE